MEKLTKILHIEDDPAILEITDIALTVIGGFQVEQADCGEKGLACIQRFKPDLILIDVQMPGMTGPETLVEIRKLQEFQRIPAIYMTAKLLGVPKGELEGACNLGVIPKPFDPTTLSQQIIAMWETREEHAA